MEPFLDQYGPLMGVVGLVVSLVLAALVVVQGLRLRTIARKWAELMNGSTGGNIEKLLQDHVKTLVSVDGRLDSSESRLNTLESKMESSKRYLGLVRFDAFEDVGGQQSFALAIYDERGDGTVVTSMVGRTDCRVYAKEIKGGRAGRDLSREEQGAIEAAIAQREAASAAKGGR